MRLFVFFHQIFTISTAILWFRKAVIAGEWVVRRELREGVRRVGRPMLRYKDVIKRDLRSALIDISAWEDIANHRDTWRQSVKAVVSKAEANARVQATCKGAARKERAVSARDSAGQVCTTCNRDCHSRIGLHSHTRSFPNPQR